MLPPKISREEAVRILEAQQNKPHAVVTACYKGDWYDLRGMTEQQRQIFLIEMLADKPRIINATF